MAVRWKQVMTMLLRGVSQSGTARAARCGKRDVSRAARVIRECSVDSALLASLSDREVAERWFPARPRERAEGYLHPDLDACVECKGAYRRLPLKLLWYEYRDSAGREGLKAHGYQAFRRVFAARAAQLDVTARLEHVPGDKVSGDWTGDCPHLTDPVTGRQHRTTHPSSPPRKARGRPHRGRHAVRHRRTGPGHGDGAGGPRTHRQL